MQYYLLVRNTGIAVIYKYERTGNICSFELEDQGESMIKSFIDSDILGKHFQDVKETMSLTCISCSDIACICVFVPSASVGVSSYVRPVLTHYQHD